MSKYKSQIILTFDPDQGNKSTASAFSDKAATGGVQNTVVELGVASLLEEYVDDKDVAKVKAAFAKIVTPWRLYLTGHGEWESQTLGGWTAKGVIALLKRAGLPAVDMVSVTGCGLGRDKGKAGEHRIAASVDSFAGKVHGMLQSECGVATVLHARVYDVRTAQGVGSKFTGNAPGYGLPDVGSVHKRDYSKLTFKWVDGRQRRFWAYPAESTAKDEIMSLF
jgi:hypothetical protein